MSATAETAGDLKELGDKIVGLTLKQAKELSDYIKDTYGIEPASGGAVMMAAPQDGGGGAAAAAVQTEFDVVLASAGDKKLEVVKAVKNITGSTLMEAKKVVDGAPSTIKQKASKEDADKIKAELEKAGATVQLK